MSGVSAFSNKGHPTAYLTENLDDVLRELIPLQKKVNQPFSLLRLLGQISIVDGTD